MMTPYSGNGDVVIHAVLVLIEKEDDADES